MKQEPSPRSHRVAALFAAAAFLPTPLFAQDTTQPTPPVLTDPSPPATTTPPVVVPPAPVPVETPPVATTPPPAEQVRPPLLTEPLPEEEPAATRAERQAPRANRSARTAPRAAPRQRAEAPAPRAVQARPAPAEAPAPAPAAEAAAPAPAPAEAIPPADAPPAAAPVAAADPAPAAPAEERPAGGGTSWLWLLAGAALLLGAVALLLRRRRAAHEQASYEPAYHHEEPAAAAYEPAHDVEQAPVHDRGQSPVHDPVHAPVAAAGLGAAAVPEGGRPWLELLMRPVRAGVDGQDAVVEFELSVDNQGNAPARDVRISTWMFAAGSAQESEMERTLIERPTNPSIPEGTIDPGDARRIATAVALPTAGLQQDAVLPVVVADARYVLPDGSEAHTSASFAVGVPYGEDLAHFALDNPSGLHDHVEARPLGEPERD